MSLEVVQINDREPESEVVTPHPRQVVDDIIALWKEDPLTESLGAAKLHGQVKKRHPNWLVLEKRVRQLLKEFGLNVNLTAQQVSYAKDIKAHPTPKDVIMPENVQVTMTLKRGKGLYAKRPIKKGTILWEEAPLFYVPQLQSTPLMKQGQCCAYCGKVLEKNNANLTLGLDCQLCPMVWCLQRCKSSNTLHLALYHLTGKRLIDAEKFMELEDYCLQELWNALYALAHIQAQIIMEKKPEAGKLSLKDKFDSLALVSQQVRYRAVNLGAGAFDLMTGGALFVEEQQEILWKDGYSKFTAVFPRLSGVTYDDFLTMLGTYNINNLDLNVFMIQLHLNHNCDPNVDVNTHATDRSKPLKVVADRDIAGGEELTTTYVNPSHPVLQRLRELRVNWGFVCACNRCKLEKQQDQRKQSLLKPLQTKEDIRKMLKEEEPSQEIELEVPSPSLGERRKLVRFDDNVLQLTQETENLPGDANIYETYHKTK